MKTHKRCLESSLEKNQQRTQMNKGKSDLVELPQDD